MSVVAGSALRRGDFIRNAKAERHNLMLVLSRSETAKALHLFSITAVMKKDVRGIQATVLSPDDISVSGASLVSM